MARKVSVGDLEIAVLWLQSNEGDAGEADACNRVAAMLEAEIAARRTEQVARAAVREHGIPLSAARKAARKVVDRAD